VKSPLLSAFSLIAVFFAVQALGQQRKAQMSDEEIRALVRERTEDPRRTVGVIIGLIDENGTRVITYGKPSLDSDQMLNGNTLFKISSVTKVFTSILLAEMVERGEVSLDDTISKYLPNSVKTPSRGGKEILLRHLATHTSGLPRDYDNNKEGESYSVEKLYAFLSKFELSRDIGSQYEYSNLGMALLAHILSQRAGTDYETLLRDRVLDPLQMNQTRIKLTDEMQKGLPQAYLEGKPVNLLDPYAPFGGVGALDSTANDLLRFLGANIGLISTPLQAVLQRTHLPLHSATGPQEIGLGWQIMKNPDNDNDRMIFHDGGGAGTRSFIGFDPKKRKGVVMFWNSNFSLDDIGIHLVEDAFPLAQALKPVPIDARIFDAYVGQYRFEQQPFDILSLSREGGRFFGQIKQSKLEFFPASETEWFCGAIESQFSVIRDDKGRAIRIILHQDGADYPAMKIK
jgi:CubicO group peptidase (beta-lactamase class C family)